MADRINETVGALVTRGRAWRPSADGTVFNSETGEWLMPSEVQVEFALAAFARSVLLTLEESEEWGPDVLDLIAFDARERSLAGMDSEGRFSLSLDDVEGCDNVRIGEV